MLHLMPKKKKKIKKPFHQSQLGNVHPKNEPN